MRSRRGINADELTAKEGSQVYADWAGHLFCLCRKHKYPSVNLSAMSDEDVTTFFEAVDTLTGQPSGSAVVSSART